MSILYLIFKKTFITNFNKIILHIFLEFLPFHIFKNKTDTV